MYYAVVRDLSVGTPIWVLSVATCVAPSTEYLCMKYTSNNLIFIVTLTLYLTLTLTDPSDTILYVLFSSYRNLAKPGGHVARLVGGAVLNLRLLLRQFAPIRSPIWILGTRIGVPTLGSRTTLNVKVDRISSCVIVAVFVIRNSINM